MHQIRIVNGDVLRSVLREVKEHHGSHRNAAAWLGVKQSTFTRLLNGSTSEFMNSTTYSTIKKTLEEHDPGPFGTIVEPDPPYLGLLDAFKASVLTFDADLVRQRYVRWLDEEFVRIKRRVGPAFEELWAQPIYKRRFTDFLKTLARSEERPDPRDKRLWLALYRAVEPLSDAASSWGVERSWKEMDEDGDLKAFLKAALKREQVLLQREGDFDRMRMTKDPQLDEYKGWLAGVGEPDFDEGSAVPMEFWDGFFDQPDSG